MATRQDARPGLPGIASRALADAWCYRSQISLRLPAASYRPRFVGPAGNRRASEVLATLKRDGIALLPGYFGEPLLSALRDGFEAVIAQLPPSDLIRDAFNGDDFMHAAPIFLDAALDDLVLQVVGEYYRRPFYLGRANATRLLPSDAHGEGSFQWHHDTRGKQPKLMVLLTDLEPDGQCMRYIKGSHQRLYNHDRMYKGSRFEEDFRHHPAPEADVVRVAGRAGTAALFDTNGLHTGTRNPSPGRDTVIFNYTTGRNVRTMHYNRRDVDTLTPAKQRLVMANPKRVILDPSVPGGDSPADGGPRPQTS